MPDEGPEHPRSISVVCPHCDTRAQFLHRITFEAVAGVPRRVVGRRMYGGPADVEIGGWTCGVCRMPIIAVTEGDTVRSHEPRTLPRVEFPHVPDPIADDAQEAHRCFHVEAYKASVTMARRAVQGAARAHGAPERTLRSEIEWLGTANKITPQLVGFAHEIRLTGNAGAHPGAPPVAKEEAAAILQFMDDFLHHMYEMPARLQEVRERAQEQREAED